MFLSGNWAEFVRIQSDPIVLSFISNSSNLILKIQDFFQVYGFSKFQQAMTFVLH
jgi:hypothetical protein